jgi:branched-chain amino acid transport system substrate-binding protein
MLTPRRWCLLAGLVLAAGAAGCAAVSKVGPPTTVRIAVQSPLSGGQAILGRGLKEGVELAAEASNRDPESAGVRFEVVAFDDQTKPAVGVANARAMVADPTIMAVIGHLNSGVAIPASQIYHAAGLAMISPANTNPTVTDRGLGNVFRVVGRDDMQGAAAAEFSQKGLKARTAYVVHDGSSYGAGTARSFTIHGTRLGLAVSGSVDARTTAQVARALDEIQERTPDVVFFGGLYTDAAPFLRQLRQRGVAAAFVGPDAFDSSDFAVLAGRDAVGAYYVTVVGPTSWYAEAAAFHDAYVRRFGHEPQPYAASAYDAAMVAVRAITVMRRQGTPLSRAGIATAIRTVAFQGITGPIAFDAAGDLAAAPYFVLRVERSDPRRWEDNHEAYRTTLPHR